MCKNCFGPCIVSAIATWGFFALLLTLLAVKDAFMNAIWLTLLLSVAMISCPLVHQKLAECCKVMPKKKK